MFVAPDSKPVRRLSPHVTVLFCGASGAGKSTIRDAVMRQLEHDGHLYPVRESFARPLKAKLRSQEFRPHTVEWRTACQSEGDHQRSIDPDVYVKQLANRIRAHVSPCCFLIDDGRRINEGAVADLVFRLKTTRSNLLTEEQRKHPSETEWVQMEANETFENDWPEHIEEIAKIISCKIIAFALASDTNEWESAA